MYDDLYDLIEKHHGSNSIIADIDTEDTFGNPYTDEVSLWEEIDNYPIH